MATALQTLEGLLTEQKELAKATKLKEAEEAKSRGEVVPVLVGVPVTEPPHSTLFGVPQKTDLTAESLAKVE